MVLLVSNLSKSFRSRVVLNDFSLDLGESEIVFLTGPSGVGKSTALRSIANLDPYDAGTITLNGKTASDIGCSAWRRDVMYVPQYRITLNCTPRELFVRSLAFCSRDLHGNDAETRTEAYVQLCQAMGLDSDHINRHKWSELSGGQAQRACVGLCISLKPEVLLLDEPSSSCDHQSTLLVERAIMDSAIASIWVSHDVEQPIRVGGRICNMKVGV